MPKIPTDPIAFSAGNAANVGGDVELNKAISLKNQGIKTPQQVDKAASGFEALLLHQMMKSMFSTVDKTGFLGDDSNQADMMRDMFTQSIADEVAKGKGIGVKEVIKREINKQQEAAQKRSSSS